MKAPTLIEGSGASNNFTFDRVLDAGVSQEVMYGYVARPTVQSLMNGFNGTIFAYG